MVQLIVTAPTPERLKRARTLQRKLLELILAAKTAILEVIPTPRESSISFKWRFTSPEYDGFPSEPEEVNEFHPLPQKITIKWSLEDINRCKKAIDGGFISITASSQSHRWTRQDIQEYMKYTGALTVVPIREYEASQNKISTKACKSKAQVSISQMPLSAIIPLHKNEVEILASEEAQCNEAPTSVISGRFHEGHGTSDLKLLCNQAWSHSENQYTTNDCKKKYTIATLNIGLTFAIQLKEQIQRVNTLEKENDKLKVQVLQLEHDQAMLQQEITNTREKDEKDVSAARLEGEKIAEENILRLWNSAKERGRVIGVCAMEKMFQRQGIPSGITSDVRNDLSTPSLVIPNLDIGERRDSKSALKRMPPICADESRSHLSKAGALHLPPPTNPTDPVDHATTSSNDLLPTVATFDSQESRRGTATTNASIVHFVSQATADSPRATQGTTYPTLLRLSQDTDEYYYIGHFVVSSVVTTTDFNQVLENLPDLSSNDKHTKQKLLKERDRALGSISESLNDLPVDIYNLQYAFFGKEQYKILVDAKKKYDAMKAADNTINLLIEADDQTDKCPTPSTTMDKASQTGLLSEPHNHDITPLPLKIPTAPKAMRSDHSTIEVQTLSGPIHHNSIRSSLSQTINTPKGPAAMMRVYPPASDKEALRLSNPTRSSTISTNNSPVFGTSNKPVVEGRSYTNNDKFKSLATPNCHHATGSPLPSPRKNHEERIQRKRKHTSDNEDRSLREHSSGFGKTISSGSVQIFVFAGEFCGNRIDKVGVVCTGV
ncbi:hypothetical protein BTUL_0044g00740 [Botrytis tulipae]|uniref:Uncharacterized protein n=1 Tax=Botrytis tulipae TaxID=87230 RepID=A0A4Z1ESB5_9HELO|nr:hypothetical protein BTUL_0044g00740 [Botrytis tulipae]